MQFIRTTIQYIKSLCSVKEKRANVQVTFEPNVPQTDDQLKNCRTLVLLDYVAEYVDDLPDNHSIMKNTIYIVGENGYQWQAAFKCPCGCGDLIQLSLLEDHTPSWKIIINKKGTITISPSIERTIGCRSHFNLKKGRIIWWQYDL